MYATIFREKNIEHKMCFDICLQLLSETFSFYEEFSEVVSLFMCIGLHVKYPLFLAGFNET
jgi:hypothetical protein